MIHVLNQGLENSMARMTVECVAARVPVEAEHEFWLLQRRLIAHADRCLETLRNIEINGEAAGALHSLGFLYADQGRLKEAETMYERALEGNEKAWGRKIVDARYSHNLGNL